MIALEFKNFMNYFVQNVPEDNSLALPTNSLPPIFASIEYNFLEPFIEIEKNHL